MYIAYIICIIKDCILCTWMDVVCIYKGHILRDVHIILEGPTSMAKLFFVVVVSASKDLHPIMKSASSFSLTMLAV